PTDTTLNSIHLDSLDAISDEDNLIALATPTEPAQAETAKPEERKQSSKVSRPTVEEVLANNQDVFLREVSCADTSAFHDKYDNMIASNDARSFKRADQSNVIVMNSKAPAKSKHAGQVAGVAVDRIS